MGGNSPGLRPLTLPERHYSWMYGLLPAGLIYVVLVGLTYLLTRPDMSIFRYYLDFHDAHEPLTGLPINFQMIMARGFYLVAYMTWGRSTGHLIIGAHVIDRKTGRRMKTWQKWVRGLAQMSLGSFYTIMDGISFLLILVDRQERRSAYDWIAGTVVVMGDLPPEPETVPGRSWIGELSRALRGRPAPESQ